MFAKIERAILRVINKVIYRGKKVPKNLPILSGEDLNDLITHSIIKGNPYMVARFGSIELDSALYPYLTDLPLITRYKLYAQKKITFLRYNSKHAESLMNPLCNNAGFFPNDISLLGDYSKLLLQEDSKNCDCLCCSPWVNEDLAFPFFSPGIVFGNLSDMEPYDYNKPWSSALRGKRVLVIHPFVETIKKQYARRELLWENKNVLPEFELHTIKAVQSLAGEKTCFASWFDALQSMKDEMDSIEYDVAIIGCGAYGFHLAAHAKRKGKVSIHLGGATQILFGIKGKRWDENPMVNKFYNEYWVRPLPEETPIQNNKVEGGCYW